MLLAALVPLLSEPARDILSIAGLVLTIVGFIVAIIQIWRVRSAALAAKQAADAALRESRTYYERYVISSIHRLVNEAKIHVDNKAWPLAAIRLDDLADQAAQLANEDASWRQHADQLRKWSTTMRRLASGQLQKLATTKWSEFTLAFGRQIDQGIGPFAVTPREEADDSPR